MRDPGQHTWSEVLAWTCLAALLIAGLPLFVCIPLCGDVTLYDVAARNVLDGGIHYRDVFDTNLPGIVWLHAVIRGLLGWSSEAIRGVDLLIVAASIVLLVYWLRPLGLSPAAGAWTAVALAAFYLGTTEWSHCQRNTWMLLPALGALFLRRRQAASLVSAAPSPRTVALWAGVEGAWWALAFWIKPFVVVPALACWFVAAVLVRRQGRSAGRRLLLDTAGLLAGGLLVGGLGAVWLWGSGTWPYFREVFFDWNPEYASWSVPLLFRIKRHFTAFGFWSWIEALALLVAVALLCRAFVARRSSRPVPVLLTQALLAAFYLGWVQSDYLQMPFDYIFVPEVLLALTLLLGQFWWLGRTLPGRLGFAALAFWIVLSHPVFQAERLRLWGRCWTEGSTPRMRDRLGLAREIHSPAWEELERVAEYLRGLDLHDGDLTCYNSSPHPLYLELGLKPAVRFMHFETMFLFFPRHLDKICQELAASRQRYVVSDLRVVGLSDAQIAASDSPAALPRGFPKRFADCFPWNEPICFGAGRYLVHRVTRPVERLRPETPRSPVAP